MSGDLSLELMEQCLGNGARRFLAKPLLEEEVRNILDKIEALWIIRNLDSKAAIGMPRFIGESYMAQKIKEEIAAIRGEPGPILIEGESGTGKEVVSKILHLQENIGPFVQVNIASIPETLFESELFGHVKGAFTGADQNKIGLAEAAHGGDLFLDEIEAMPLSQQVKLLRFLETGEIRRVGSKEPMMIKTRVIIATNQNLQELVNAGLFREDLMWRISGKKLTLPPLRERKDDITELARYFISQDRPRRNKQLSEEAIKELKTYNWPGNVRELKRICEQISLSAPLPIIRAEDVRFFLNPHKASHITNKEETSGLDFKKGLNVLMAEYEKMIFIETFKQYKEIDEICSILQISRSSYYKKVKEHNLDI
jgi:DNA-binding NtrC family response regulator